jgi:glutamyl-tRNA synthetase
MSVHELQVEEGFESVSIAAFLSRLGTSKPIEAFQTVDEVVENFDISSFSRANPRFVFEDLQRLNAKILHGMSYERACERFAELGIDKVSEEFWNVARPNLAVLRDIADWMRVAKGPVTPVIDDKEFAQAAADVLPNAPWNRDTWNTWVNAVKEKTGRKGKDLFMPLRQALTGMSHGPELADLLPLIGYDRARARLAGQAE